LAGSIKEIASMSYSKLGLILRGIAMGIAEVIPGVSGGTIAFITGIYQTLLDSIKAVDASFIRDVSKFELKSAFTRVNGAFLLWLFGGMGLGVLGGVFFVSSLLESHPETVWSFFFGLILASIPMVLAMIKNKSLSSILLFILGAIIAFGVTKISPVEAGSNPLYLYLGGAIAICALVLPGISGSFILLLMGLYTTVIPTIKAFLKSPELSEFTIILWFAFGCLTGLVLFSRAISAAFKKYHDQTIALLAGFMLGSLNKIWPWRNPTTVLDKPSGEIKTLTSQDLASFDINAEGIKIISETNVLPNNYFSDPQLLPVLLAFLIGLGCMFVLNKLDLMEK